MAAAVRARRLDALVVELIVQISLIPHRWRAAPLVIPSSPDARGASRGVPLVEATTFSGDHLGKPPTARCRSVACPTGALALARFGRTRPPPVRLRIRRIRARASPPASSVSLWTLPVCVRASGPRATDASGGSSFACGTPSARSDQATTTTSNRRTLLDTETNPAPLHDNTRISSLRRSSGAFRVKKERRAFGRPR